MLLSPTTGYGAPTSMLHTLHVRNLALIESAELRLDGRAEKQRGSRTIRESSGMVVMAVGSEKWPASIAAEGLCRGEIPRLVALRA